VTKQPLWRKSGRHINIFDILAVQLAAAYCTPACSSARPFGRHANLARPDWAADEARVSHTAPGCAPLRRTTSPASPSTLKPRSPPPPSPGIRVRQATTLLLRSRRRCNGCGGLAGSVRSGVGVRPPRGGPPRRPHRRPPGGRARRRRRLLQGARYVRHSSFKHFSLCCGSINFVMGIVGVQCWSIR
jgi:hypothetical protein